MINYSIQVVSHNIDLASARIEDIMRNLYDAMNGLYILSSDVDKITTMLIALARNHHVTKTSLSFLDNGTINIVIEYTLKSIRSINTSITIVPLDDDYNTSMYADILKAVKAAHLLFNLSEEEDRRHGKK